MLPDFLWIFAGICMDVLCVDGLELWFSMGFSSFLYFLVFYGFFYDFSYLFQRKNWIKTTLNDGQFFFTEESHLAFTGHPESHGTFLL